MNRWTDAWTEGRTENNVAMRGSDVASLVEFLQWFRS